MLTTSTLTRVAVPTSSAKAWAAEAEMLSFPELGPWDEFYLQAVALAGQNMGLDATEGLQELEHGDCDVLVLDGLEIDSRLPPTPKNGYRPAGKQATSEAILIGTVGQIATPIGFTEEKDGRYVQEIAPVVGLEDQMSSSGKADFNPHQDNAFLPRWSRPWSLWLLGLVNEDRIPTYIYSIDPAVDRLGSRRVENLMRDEFRIEAPPSFRFAGGPLVVEGRPLFEWDSHTGRIVSGFNHRCRITGSTERARDAYEALCQVLDSQAPLEVTITPGRMLGFNNTRVLHGRPAIQSGNRWLQRAYAARTSDYARMEQVAGHRGPIFASTAFLN